MGFQLSESNESFAVVTKGVHSMFRYKWLVLVLALLLLLPACAKKEVVPVEAEPEPIEEVPVPPPPLEEPEEEVVEEKEPVVLKDIFFDYDKYDIKGEFKSVLAGNAEILNNNADIDVLIEGHCDERGTSEYNLALGEKRAKAVMDFFIAYGLNANRLSMVSYGEERPFDRGHDEGAWAMNRRAHLVIK